MKPANMEAAMYLRKSRAEEGQSAEEVLTHHRTALTRYAAAHGIHIVEIYQEIASGESLYARPQMLRLLEDVEKGRYDCVLCMDMDRLSRGSMREQGMILDAFKSSGTLIVTPDKTYDLSVDTDEQYAELKTFISRQEYKAITKRLRVGLNRSIAEGCYVANAPYGYRKVTVGRKPTLEIYEPEAKFVRMIFELYVQGYGCVSIARYINKLGARPHRSAEFSRNSVKKIIDNPTYIGKIVWNQKHHIKKGVKGNPKTITVYLPRDQWTITDGLHPAIIDRELWDKAQAIARGRYTPARNDGTVRSSLAGLVRCSKCGGRMHRMSMDARHGAAYLNCQKKGCCAGTKFDLVEFAVIERLQEILNEWELDAKSEAETGAVEMRREALTAVREELAAAERAKIRLYDLVESGTYSASEFRERMDGAKKRIAELQRQMDSLQSALYAAENQTLQERIALLRSVIDAFWTSDPPRRNALLKSVIRVVWYTKEKKPSRGSLN